jgi:hypothetical protein
MAYAGAVRRALVIAAMAATPAAGRAGPASAEDRLAALVAELPRCAAERAHCLAVQLHVTLVDDRPIATAAWLALELAAANRHFAALSIGFQVAGVDALPASADHVVGRADRDALGKGRLAGALLHVFIVGQLDDIDDLGSVIRGVTWRTRADPRKYVLVSTAAPERTLAHEMGHVFGLPHSTYPISIMNKTERAAPPPADRTFADEEYAVMRGGLRDLLRAGWAADLAR